MEPLYVKATVLEDKGIQSFQSEGKTIEYRNALVRIGNTIVRVKSEKDVDLRDKIDQEVTLLVEIRADQRLSAVLKVIGVE